MPASGVIFLHRPGEAQGALLNQIQQVKTLVLVTLGQVDHQPQVGRDHLVLGPLARFQGAALQIVEVTGGACSAGFAAALLQLGHGLHLAAQGELLLRGQQLMATNLT